MKQALRLDFDRRLTLHFRGSAITPDAGLLPYRELDDAFGLTDARADTRTGKNIRHLLGGLPRQSVFRQLAGYEDVNDADRLRRGPAMRWVVGDWAGICRLCQPDGTLRDDVVEPAREPRRARRSDRPMDRQGGSAATTQDHRARHGFERKPDLRREEGGAYNGHFGCTCYDRLFVFNQLGGVERCALRSRNVHSTDDWRAVLEPVVALYRDILKRLYFRGYAAFANPEIYEFLEAECMGYAIRLPANRVLQDRIGYLLKRLVGRPPHKLHRYFASFSYQAQSWKKSRRIVAKVDWHLQ